ncbi:MAG: type II toxin-antitoxin system VapC family toxin [Caulobacter sp.]|nr:type II toxin-antitoxin system VapC family toxin [Caulobacter sp.]
MFLLDTNVVSELRKAKRGRADTNVVVWTANTPTRDTFISAVTILELEMGVLIVGRRDPQQGRVLRRWMEDQVVAVFEDRILAVDEAVARRAAALHVPDPRPDRDALIAATALVHGMTVVTRNIGDFAPTGVSLLNPWRPA